MFEVENLKDPRCMLIREPLQELAKDSFGHFKISLTVAGRLVFVKLLQQFYSDTFFGSCRNNALGFLPPF